MATKEWLKVLESRHIITGELILTSKLKIFDTCEYLVKYLPLVQKDEKNVNDVATEPHEFTHIVDSLRYFCVNFTNSASKVEQEDLTKFYTATEIQDYKPYGNKVIQTSTRVSRR